MSETKSSLLLCPVCGEQLFKTENTYRCENNHSYDISKKGYVNLLMSQRSSKKRHGDDKLMVTARRDFLGGGHYAPLLDALVSCVKDNAPDNAVIVDAGCGEGYYTAAVHNALPRADIYGIDISKDALIFAAKRDKELTLAAASASDIPVKGSSADVVLSVFAPAFPQEFSRLLKTRGVLIRAVPLEDHLYGLKQAIYDNAYKNPPDDNELDGFEIVSSRTVSFLMELESPKDINDLFMMTPYYYKTSRKDQEKLRSLSRLETRAEFGIITYTKKGMQ